MYRKRYLPRANQSNFFPGPVEIDCLITTKVYDACRQQDCEFFEFNVDMPEDIDLSDNLSAYAEVIPGSIDFEVIDIQLINGGPLSRVRLEVCARINVFLVDLAAGEDELVEEGAVVCFEKDVILYLPDPDRMDAIAEAVFQIAGDPVVELNNEDGAVIFVPVGAFIIVKSVAEVQLLVPTFGFCPTPPLCEDFPTTDPCEEFQFLPFPDFYPPQPSGSNDGS